MPESSYHFEINICHKRKIEISVTKNLGEDVVLRWCGVVVFSTAQLHSTKHELKFCKGSNAAHSVSEVHDCEDL